MFFVAPMNIHMDFTALYKCQFIIIYCHLGGVIDADIL